MKNWKGPLLLFTAALIWGTTFVAQSASVDLVGPFTFVSIRNFIGSAFLVPCMYVLKKLNPQPARTLTEEEKRADRKNLIIGGICCGLILFVSATLQQAGLAYTSVGKASFITAMYIVFVPLTGIFLKKRIGLRIWVSVLMATVGLYLLSMQNSFILEKGDFLVLLCAFGYTGHILVVDYFSPKVDGVKLSCIQFLTCGIAAAVGMAFEHPEMASILAAMGAILYAGIMSSGIAYTCQVVGQKNMNPAVASLIMSLESVIGALSGWLFLHQILSTREIIGCTVMFAAIILCQLPVKEKTV